MKALVGLGAWSLSSSAALRPSCCGWVTPIGQSTGACPLGSWAASLVCVMKALVGPGAVDAVVFGRLEAVVLLLGDADRPVGRGLPAGQLGRQLGLRDEGVGGAGRRGRRPLRPP